MHPPEWRPPRGLDVGPASSQAHLAHRTGTAGLARPAAKLTSPTARAPPAAPPDRTAGGKPPRANRAARLRARPPRQGDSMHLPEPIPPVVHDETFAGVTYHVRGELVPELQVDLGGMSVMFEHHVLLWKETQVSIELRKLSGAVKRK